MITDSVNIWELHEEMGCNTFGEAYTCGCWICADCGRLHPCHPGATPLNLPHTGSPEERASEQSFRDAVEEEAQRQIRDGEA